MSTIDLLQTISLILYGIAIIMIGKKLRGTP